MTVLPKEGDVAAVRSTKAEHRTSAASPRTDTALNREPLGNQIATKVRQDILLGRLPAGRHLTQQELCAKYGTSRMPARDALLLLSYEGFVVDEGAGRVRVAPLTRRDVEDLFLIEGHLHGLACRLVAERASDDEIGELHSVSQAMQQALAGGDKAAASELQQEFHRLINSFAQSPKLRSAIRPLAQQIPRDFILHVPEWQGKAVSMQRRVLAAFRAGDGVAAERIMATHTRQAGTAYLEHLRSQGAVLDG